MEIVVNHKRYAYIPPGKNKLLLLEWQPIKEKDKIKIMTQSEKNEVKRRVINWVLLIECISAVLKIIYENHLTK